MKTFIRFFCNILFVVFVAMALVPCYMLALRLTPNLTYVFIGMYGLLGIIGELFVLSFFGSDDE